MTFLRIKFIKEILLPLMMAYQKGLENNLEEAKQRDKILIVDDFHTLRRIVRSQISQTMEKAGYKIVEKEDGEVALDYIKQHPEGIAAVITDQNMPKMHGTTLIPHVQELCPEAVIILYTAEYWDVIKAREELGVYGILKPGTKGKILNILCEDLNIS